MRISAQQPRTPVVEAGAGFLKKEQEIEGTAPARPALLRDAGEGSEGN